MESLLISNQEVYRKNLLNNFPLELPSSNLLLPIEGCYSDEIDRRLMIRQQSIFYEKKWPEVDFDEAREFGYAWAQFPGLSYTGELYYLPAFLGYFYEVKNMNKGNLCDYFNSMFLGMFSDAEILEKLTIEQAKLTALFLVNMANLLDDGHGNAQLYQRAVTNKWGHLLLF
ncbi:hypothetical protein [Vreelandella sp. GE22]